MVKHGTTTAYLVHGCRCDTCRTAQSRHQKRYRLDRERGIARLVDAEPLRQHVAMLKEAGLSQWDIAIAAGWKSRNALADALTRKMVTPRTMRRVLAVTAPPASRRNGYVDATASRRRLQALAVMGWPTRQIAARLGNLDPQTYRYIANGRTRTIRRRTEQAIAELYDELWATPGPSRKSASIAKSKGWVPPLAWDDDSIADPSARPHGADWKPTNQRGLREVLEDFEDTRHYHGGELRLAAMRMGMTPQALERALFRARQQGHQVTFHKDRATA